MFPSSCLFLPPAPRNRHQVRSAMRAIKTFRGSYHPTYRCTLNITSAELFRKNNKRRPGSFSISFPSPWMPGSYVNPTFPITFRLTWFTSENALAPPHPRMNRQLRPSLARIRHPRLIGLSLHNSAPTTDSDLRTKIKTIQDKFYLVSVCSTLPIPNEQPISPLS